MNSFKCLHLFVLVKSQFTKNSRGNIPKFMYFGLILWVPK